MTAFRSLCGHIRTQLPIGPQVLYLGQSILQEGILRPTSGALARREYIQILRATFPWVDIVDQRIFLMGFDAGEQWGVCNRDIPEETPTVETWLTSTEKSFGHVPTKVLHSEPGDELRQRDTEPIGDDLHAANTDLFLSSLKVGDVAAVDPEVDSGIDL